MSKEISKETWDEYYAKVYGYFYRRIDNKSCVEDLTSQTLNDFFLSKTEIHNQHAFLWTIAKRQLIKFIQQKDKNFANFAIEDLENYENTSTNPYNSNYLYKLEKLKDCVKNELNDLDKEIVEMSITEEFDSQTIAQKLEISSVNVRVRLFRAIKKLKQKCKEIWFEV